MSDGTGIAVAAWLAFIAFQIWHQHRIDTTPPRAGEKGK